jgi:hypothetical protein
MEAPRPSKANSHVNHAQKEADLFDGCHAVSKSNSYAKGATLLQTSPGRTARPQCVDEFSFRDKILSRRLGRDFSDAVRRSGTAVIYLT